MKRTVRLAQAGRTLTLSAAAPDPLAAIREVAERHAPEGGYGETAWNAEERTVFWNAADWSSGDEVEDAERAFTSIAGVEDIDVDYEVDIAAVCTPEDGWQIVYPASTTTASLEEIVALAKEELPPLPADGDLTPPQFKLASELVAAYTATAEAVKDALA